MCTLFSILSVQIARICSWSEFPKYSILKEGSQDIIKTTIAMPAVRLIAICLEVGFYSLQFKSVERTSNGIELKSHAWVFSDDRYLS